MNQLVLCQQILTEIKDFVMPTIGLIGLGGGLVALYFRASLAETIIGKLNGRYVHSSVWGATNQRLEDRLTSMEHRLDVLETKVDNGFEAVRKQIADVER